MNTLQFIDFCIDFNIGGNDFGLFYGSPVLELV